MITKRCKGRISLPTACLWLLSIGLSITLASGCNGEPASDSTETAADSSPVSAQLAGYNFTPQQVSSIIGNRMHDAHTEAAGLECKACHRNPDEFLTHESALAACDECHSGQIVALAVWENHCLSCHQFVKYKEKYADSTHILRELCQDCHGEGTMFYRAFEPTSPHDVTCDNCHQPHKTALVVAGDLCSQCHEDITSVVSEENKVHGSCIVCHTPHSELPRSEELCGKCHIATSNVLVHNVPEHPRNCLSCHSAHFTETEITSEACLVCHDDTFYGGRSNLPRAHRDCQSCHYAGNFDYLGDAQCAKCHVEEGEVVARMTLPDEHRTCTTCHQPHSWHTNFEHNCDRCHDVESVLEHRLSFHQASCHDCHDPHHTELMAKSGHCEGCHGQGKFPYFRADLPDMHVQCANCHSQVAIDSRDFAFIGAASSCMVCHAVADPEAGNAWDDAPSGHHICQACHFAHTFDTDPSSMRCDLCHRDIFTQFPSVEHSDCFNCHELGHVAAFTSIESSCNLCHAEIVAEITVPMKQDCLLCHAPHDFTVDAKSCTVCHAEPPALHASHAALQCLDCHSGHSLASDLAGCRTCHANLPADCASDNCIECHDFGS